jgi:hypothetical protein
VASPANGGSGYIQGLELTFQTPFFFLPGRAASSAIYSNYAYVDSDLKEFSPVSNPLPMTGLAKNTATVDLWYANGPIEARLGYKYHSADDRDLRLERRGPADPGEREDPRLQLVLQLQRPRRRAFPGQQPDQRGCGCTATTIPTASAATTATAVAS